MKLTMFFVEVQPLFKRVVGVDMTALEMVVVVEDLELARVERVEGRKEGGREEDREGGIRRAKKERGVQGWRACP